jgi:hypothetical protein
MDDHGFEYDFSRWTLEDIVAFESASNLTERLPLMAKVIVRNPYSVDLADPGDWQRLSALQWAEIRSHFTEHVKAIFR